MSDELTLDVGLALDLKNGFRRNGWKHAAEIKKLSEGSTLRHVREYVLGNAEIRPHEAGSFAKPNLRFDKRKEGWELREHTGRSIISVDDLEPVPFLRDGEKSIKGYDLIGRARYELNANLGQEDAEFLLEHHVKIPKEFQQYHLVFMGTIWRRVDGLLCVPCLYWYGGQWHLHWLWLVLDSGSYVRLLRPRK